MHTRDSASARDARTGGREGGGLGAEVGWDKGLRQDRSMLGRKDGRRDASSFMDGNRASGMDNGVVSPRARGVSRRWGGGDPLGGALLPRVPRTQRHCMTLSKDASYTTYACAHGLTYTRMHAHMCSHTCMYPHTPRSPVTNVAPGKGTGPQGLLCPHP